MDTLGGGAVAKLDVVVAAVAGLTYFQPYREYMSPCGYCRRPHNKGRMAYGMHCHRMSATDYDAMLDDGWMRSGSHVYLPSNAKSCCPNFVVRCDAVKYAPTRDHLRVLSRLAAHLRGDVPLVLPPLTDDVLERALRLTLLGRAREAAEAIVRFKDAGDAGDAAEGDDEMGVHSHAGPAAGWARLLHDAVPGLKRHYAEGAPTEAADLAATRVLYVHHALTAPVTADGAAPALHHLAAAVGIALACLAAAPACSALGTAPLIPAALARVVEKVTISTAADFAGGARRKGRDAAAAAAAPAAAWVSNAALTVAHMSAAGSSSGGDSPAAMVGALVHAFNTAWAAVGGGMEAAPAAAPLPAAFITVSLQEGHAAHDLAARAAALQGRLWEQLAPVLAAGAVAATAARAARVGTPSGINCLNAHDPASWALLAAHYRQQQVGRERAGRAMFRADPGNFALNNDDDSPSDDESGGAADGAGSGEAGGSAEAAAAAAAAAQLQKREEKVEKEVADSTRELEAYMTQGVGDAMRALRASGTPVAAAPTLPHQAVPRDRLAHLPLLTDDVVVAPNTDVAVVWPPGAGGSGRGHTLTVHLAKPQYTPESHELYARFNLSLHRGTPKSNSKEAYTRHLVKSPIVPMAPACLGTLMRLRAAAWQPAAAVEGERVWDGRGAEALRSVAAGASQPLLAPSTASGAALLALAGRDAVVGCALMSMRGRGLYGTPTAEADGASPWHMTHLMPLPAVLDALVPATGDVAAMLGLPVAGVVLGLYHLAALCYAAGQGVIVASAAVSSAPPAGLDLPPHVLAAMGMGAGMAGAPSLTEQRARVAQTRLRSLLQPATLQSALVEFLSDNDERLQWLVLCWDAVVQGLPQGEPVAPAPASAGAGGDGAATPAHPLDAFFTAVPDASAALTATAGGGEAGKVLVDGWDLSHGFGSFHHEYRLDGRLIAVSVLDILPTRVASVYFFYDPDLRHLQLGKLSVMLELWLAHRIRATMAANPAVWGMVPCVPRPGAAGGAGAGGAAGAGDLVPLAPPMRWWDANYYVHAVRTMNYKRTFQPSQLLCPVLRQGNWVDMTPDALLWLDESPEGPLASADPSAPSAKDGADATRGLADSLALLESEEVAALVPAMMVELSGGAVYPVSGLSDTSQAMLRRGLERYGRAMGIGSVHRFLVDPRWIASLESTLQEERQARERERAAAAPAAGGAGAAAPGGSGGGVGGGAT